MVFGIGAGLRPGELVALRGGDVIRHGRQVMVHVGGPAARAGAGHLGLCRPRAASWPAARAAGSCSAPARPTAAIRTSSRNFARGLTADPAAPRLSLRRARSTFICGHLAAGTPVPVLLAITGIAEAGSLARYARHVGGVSSSKGALRARWRAEAAVSAAAG